MAIDKHLDPTYSPTEAEIVEALRTHNASIIDLLFNLVTKKLDEDEDRRKGVEQKAFSVIQVSAVLIGLLLTATTFAIKELDKYSSIFFNRWTVVPCLGIFISYLFLLVSVWNTIRVRRSFKTTAYGDLFAIDEHDKNDSAHDYKRYLIAHFWFVYSNNFKITEAKANSLRHGFVAFFAIILLLTGLTGAVSFNLYRASWKDIMDADNKDKGSSITPGSNSDTKPLPTKTPSSGSDMQKSEKPAPTKLPSGGQNMTEDKGGRKK